MITVNNELSFDASIGGLFFRRGGPTFLLNILEYYVGETLQYQTLVAVGGAM